MNTLLRVFSQTMYGVSTVATQFSSSLFKRNDFRIQEFIQSAAPTMTLLQMHKKGGPPKRYKRRKPLGDKPFAKGIVLRTLIKNPKKPNSANRKCVLLKLSTGEEKIAFVPGIGHNLQEHQSVLVKNKRLKDCPGVRLTCVRGALDLPHVKSKS